MTGRTPMPPPDQRRRAIALLVVALALVAIAVVGKLAYDRYTQRYTVERSDDGAAIARIVTARFAGASALKVGSLSGIVQSSASDVAGFGMLHADKVVKAPFAVDYFVDVAGLDASDLRWDAASRSLIVAVPDVSVGRANVDEAARTLSETRGLFVTREAADRLARVVSQRAQVTAQAEAEKPERIAVARDRARRALGKLLAVPLGAAGYGDVRVVVAFPFERGASPERMDRSRSLDEVYANRG